MPYIAKRLKWSAEICFSQKIPVDAETFCVGATNQTPNFKSLFLPTILFLPNFEFWAAQSPICMI